MQDYPIVRGQIDPIENENAPEEYKLIDWLNLLDQVTRATICMHVSESMYYTVQLCLTTYELCKMLSDTYEKTLAATKIHLIRRLYNLWMKESYSVTTLLNAYERTISQISAQGI